MKKLISIVIAVIMITTSVSGVYAAVPSLSYGTSEMEAMLALINQCKENGYNTDYEMLNYTVLNRFITYTQEDIANNVGDSRITYNTNYLNALYTDTLANLNGYLNHTKLPKSKGYTYKTGDYNISGGNIVNESGKPFFSNGYGHDRDAAKDLALFPDMGMNNIQMEIQASYAVSDNDGIAFWDYLDSGTGASVYVDDTVHRSGNNSLKVENTHEDAANVYMNVWQYIPVKPNTSYTLQFYAKGNNVNSNAIRMCSGKDGWESSRNWSTVNADWTKYSYHFTTGADDYQTMIRILIQKKAPELWFDDFSINDTEIGNAGFETAASDKQYEIDRYNENTYHMRQRLANAEKNNVSVSLLLSPHYLADYIHDTYPDASSNKYGLMSFNINDERIKALISDYTTESLKAINDFESVCGICLTNEPTFNSYANTSFYQNDYREFLRNRYNSITSLNTAWGTSYSAFNKVPMPNQWAATPAYYDWMEFNETVLNDWHVWYAGVTRNAINGTKIAGAAIYTKIMADRIIDNEKNFMDGGYDHYDFAGWQDIIGFDAYSGINGDSRISKLQSLDMLASTGNKALYDNENHIIYTSEENNYTEGHARHIYNDLWQRAIHGLDSSTIWIWTRATDTDAKKGSILNRPDCLVAAGQATLDLNRTYDIVSAFQSKEKSVALYYSKASNLYNRDYYKDALSAAYKELAMAGIRCGFVSEDVIDDIDNYDTVIFPKVTHTKASALTKISSWKNNGGKVIYIGSGCLGKNEQNKAAALTVSGTTVENSGLVNQLTDKVEYYAADANGVKIANVPIESVTYKGSTYLNICNYSESSTKTVYIKNSSGETLDEAYDVVSEVTRQGAITLAPLQTMLLKTSGEGETTVKIAPEINLITQLPQEDGTKINISWRNPDYEIQEIVVSEETLGVVSNGKAIYLQSGAYNNFWVEGLTADTQYKFTVKIKDTDGNSELYSTIGTAKQVNVERYRELFGSNKWNLKNEDRVDGTAVFIDSAEKANGNSSLKIVKNNPGTNIELLSENANKVTLTPGQEYQLSFYTKTKLQDGTANVVYWMWNTKGAFYARRNYEWVKNTYKIYNIVSENGAYSATVTGVDGSDVKITGLTQSDLNFQARFVINGAGCAWIDDIELHQINSDGTLGDNLYSADNTFEWGGISGISTRSGYGSSSGVVYIYWKNATGTTTNDIAVVDKNDNVIMAGNAATGAENDLTITNLTNGTVCDYYIRAVINGITHYIPIPVAPMYSAKNQNLLTYDGYMVPWVMESNNDWSNYKRTKFYISKDEKHSGNSSFLIKSTSVSNNWGDIRYDLKNLDTTKKYKLSLYNKTNTSRSGYFQIESTGNTFATQRITGSGTTGWTLYETEIFSPQAANMSLYLRMKGECMGDFYFDDMKLLEVDDDGNPVTGINLIEGGEFEYGQTDNLMVIPASTSATLKWTNPANVKISKVYLTDGKNMLVADDLPRTSLERQSYVLQNLTVGNTYTYKIHFKVLEGDDIVDTITFIASSNKPFNQFMSVDYKYGIYTETELTLDTSEKYSGTASMRIKSEYTTEEGQYGTVEIPAAGLDSEKTYKISFMYKNKGISGERISVRDSHNSPKAFTIVCGNNTKEWTKAEATFTGVSKIVIQLMVDKIYGTMWFDDFVLREYDQESGKCIGNNILADGGFEADNIDEVKSISFKETGDKIRANIIKYNSYLTKCYVASYDSAGRMLELDVVPANEDGELVQNVTGEVNAGANVDQVRVFVWKDMMPVATALK